VSDERLTDSIRHPLRFESNDLNVGKRTRSWTASELCGPPRATGTKCRNASLNSVSTQTGPMSESRAFCPRCGDAVPERSASDANSPLRPGAEVELCDSCYFEDFDFVDAPDRIDVRVCARCGAVYRGTDGSMSARTTTPTSPSRRSARRWASTSTSRTSPGRSTPNRSTRTRSGCTVTSRAWCAERRWTNR